MPPVNGQLGTAKDGTPVVWVESLGRAVPVAAAKQMGVRPNAAPSGGQSAIDPNAFRRAQDSVSAIADAERRTNLFRTGLVGGLTKNLPGSPAFNLDKDLDTLKARTAFDELAAMRRASPTGGALGNVTEKELALLQAAEANLDVGQGEGQIDKNLRRLRQTVVGRNQGVDVSNPFALTDQNRAAIPEGAYFKAGDGKTYRQKKGAGFKGNGVSGAASSASSLSDDDLKRALGL
jgi:hypothetical protein